MNEFGDDRKKKIQRIGQFPYKGTEKNRDSISG